MKKRTGLLLLTATLTISVVGFAGTRAAAPMARPALGFVAKVVCSNVFVGGAAPEQALSDLPDEPIARLVRTEVDEARRRVTASVPLVAERSASYRSGFGCVLEPAGRTLVAHGSAAAPADAARDSMMWPEGERVARAARGIDTTRLDAAIAEAFAEPDPALPRRTRAIVVVHGGRIVGERYADGYGAAHRFTGWSMTKSVTSALVGVLTADGRMDLDADALRPEWRGAGDPRADITLDDLLRMSSGLGFDESYTPSGGATRMLFDAADAAAVAAASPLVHAPATRWSYSSGTTNIVSSLIRAALGSDRAYHEFPRRALFDRIGMRSAVLEPDPSGTFVGSSFMYATARDWARFGLLYLQDGLWAGERVLPEGWVEYSTRPTPGAPLGQYGAHWWLNAGEAGDSTRRIWPDLPRDIYWASGFQGQYIVVVPSHDLVVVRLGVTADDRAWNLGGFLRAVIASLGTSG
ncbi:MAG TPA: serine hydrolase [Longimicrobiales bacterium]